MKNGEPDAAMFEATIGPLLAQVPGGKALHAFGEMVAVLCERDNYEGALRLESLWNDIARRHQFVLFCGYAQDLFTSSRGASAYQHVCAAHTSVLSIYRTLPRSSDAASRIAAGNLESLQFEVQRRREAEVTLRKRERELAEFLDNASEGIHKVAADGTVLYANRAELSMLGYEWHEYVGHHIAKFYVDGRQAMSILSRLASGEVLRDEPATLLCKDGSTRSVLIYSNGYFEEGQLRYTRCFTRDISQQVLAHRELEQTLADRERLLNELQKADRAKDEFLALLGHELRNPLAPIATALQLMQVRADGETERERAIIQRQVDHLIRLVDDLVDISRITRGKVELKRSSVRIHSLLERAVEQVTPLVQQRGHRLEVEADQDLVCDGDFVRLAQIVANLLSNAARYTDAGGLIQLSARAAGPDRISIHVKDNGRGMSPELMERLFEPFVQGPRGIDRAEGGLGIGLALVRSLVELHGGTVRAESDGPAKGSEFTVLLPRSQPSAPAALDSAPDEHRTAPISLRILLVDDNADAVETLGELLAMEGHEVVTFTNPTTALANLADYRPHVAILDIGLPEMDGYELGQRVRRLAGDGCLLIALTGYGQEADKARSRAARFDHHLVKPVKYPELLAVLPCPGGAHGRSRPGEGSTS
ncbi:response regulator [Ramlibacter sp. CrO1]|uniref:histidine kinase n=2 Tax=Ramlibacter algicola TaxID=2795217 RepID=A0A934URB5_9BURK|nr:response regulator [Ramlibacter algicola]